MRHQASENVPNEEELSKQASLVRKKSRVQENSKFPNDPVLLGGGLFFLPNPFDEDLVNSKNLPNFIEDALYADYFYDEQ